MGLLICKIDILYGSDVTDFTKVAPGLDPGTAEPNAIPPLLETVTLRKPCKPTARPVVCKSVVRTADPSRICLSFCGSK